MDKVTQNKYIMAIDLDQINSTMLLRFLRSVFLHLAGITSILTIILLNDLNMAQYIDLSIFILGFVIGVYYLVDSVASRILKKSNQYIMTINASNRLVNIIENLEIFPKGYKTTFDDYTFTRIIKDRSYMIKPSEFKFLRNYLSKLKIKLERANIEKNVNHIGIARKLVRNNNFTLIRVDKDMLNYKSRSNS